MFIAIAADDFSTFTDNNEAEERMDYMDYTETEYPIFTGTTFEETRDHVANYFRACYTEREDIPEYEICDITTTVIIEGTYNLHIRCDYVNRN